MRIYSLFVLFLCLAIVFSQMPSSSVPDSSSLLVSTSSLTSLSHSSIISLTSSHTGAYDPISLSTFYAFEGDTVMVNHAPRNLDIDGNVAYVVCTDRLISIDITNLDSMFILDSVVVGFELTDIEVRGNFAFVTKILHCVYPTPDKGILLIFNVSNPESIFLVDTAYMSDSLQFRAVDLEGDVAYIATEHGLLSLDIKYSDSAIFLDYVIGGNYLKDLVVDGNVAYASGSQIVKFDVTYPDSMSFICQVDTYNIIWSIDVDGDYLFAAYWNYGVKIFDVTKPYSLPRLIDSIPFPENDHPCGISVLGDWMYVTSIIKDPYGDYGEISAYDITDPSRVLLVDGLCFLSCPLFRVTNHGQTWLVAVSGMDDSLAVVRSMRVGVVDEELLTNPDTFFIALNSHPSALKVQGNYAVCVAKDDIAIVNITNPKNPILEFTYYESGGYDIDISGNYAFVTAGLANFPGCGGLFTLKVDSLPDISSISVTSSAYHKSIPGEVQVEGNIAYTFSFDTVVVRIDTVSGDTVKYLLGFLDAFDITKVSMFDSVKWLSGDTMLYSKDTFNITRPLGLRCSNDKYPIAYGELEVEGDTVYVSWRCMPFGPLYTTDSAVYCGVDNHIGFFDVTNPESVTAFVPWQFVDTTDSLRHIDSCRHNLGYATGLCSFGGALDVEGNIIYSTIGNTEWYGFPISWHDSVAFGVFSYNIQRTVGDFVCDFDWVRKRWLSTVDSFFFISHNYYPLDLLVDGDFAFCSSGSLNASHSDGIWLLDVRNSMLSGYYIPIEPDSNIRSKFNGFDIAGDYLYSVGYSKDSPHNRFWSIKVYQRNHNTTPYPKGYSNHNNRKCSLRSNPVEVSLGYSNKIVKVKLGIRSKLDNYVVDVFDLSGRIVGSKVFHGLKDGQIVEVNTVDLSTGIYFVMVRVDGLKMMRKLLIIK